LRRFLFLFSDTGGGHRASAQAVRDELVRLYGSAAQVEMVDVLVDIGRWPFYHFPRWYPQMFRLRGIPWRMGYWISDNRRLLEIASQLPWPYTGRGVMQSLCRHPADLIVSFHGLPNAALALALRRLRWNIPFAIVVLDLVSVHAGWFTRGAQTYLVPTEEARQRAWSSDVFHVPMLACLIPGIACCWQATRGTLSGYCTPGRPQPSGTSPGSSGRAIPTPTTAPRGSAAATDSLSPLS